MIASLGAADARKNRFIEAFSFSWGKVRPVSGLPPAYSVVDCILMGTDHCAPSVDHNGIFRLTFVPPWDEWDLNSVFS